MNSRRRKTSMKKANMMPKHWYKRMLRAYLPLVLITISAVIFVSFIIVSEMMRKETEKANTVTTMHVVDGIESRLEAIEGAVLREMQSNRSLHRFISTQADDNVRLTQYELSNELNSLIKGYPLISSIYIYRASDDLVLTQRFISSLDSFPDHNFIKQYYNQSGTMKWQQTRLYTDYAADPKEAVISLTQKVPLPLGSQGLVVVNVKVEGILRLAKAMINEQLTVLEIRDQNNRLIYPQREAEIPGDAKYTLSHQSPSLGWTFHSGLSSDSLYDWVSVIAFIWIVIGIGIVIVSISMTIYILKRNYRPIELILKKIGQTPLRNLPKDKAMDEFAYIERAIENLVEQSKHYELKHQRDLALGKRQFLRDLLEGQHSLSTEEWKDKAKAFLLPRSISHAAVVLIEVKRYGDLENGNKERDKSFLKFSLANVIVEHMKAEVHHVETEWISPDRLAVILLAKSAGELDKQAVYPALEKVSRWIWNNLNIAIRIGVGQAFAKVNNIARSYELAEEALRYQLITDYEKPIFYENIPRASRHSYRYYQTFTSCMKSMHQLDDSWNERIDAIFEQMKQDWLEDEEIRSILQFAIVMYLDEAGAIANKELRDQLCHMTLQLREECEQSDRLEELQSLFNDHAEQFYRRYAGYKRSSKYLETISQVRRYMEEHYTDPDLSLTQIGDKFGLKPKYASQLFKEEFQMKFVDYLVQLRMEEAKRRLCDTDESVQEIAARVGYASSISFGRMFKKIEGVTPGDYRKLMLLGDRQASV